MKQNAIVNTDSVALPRLKKQGFSPNCIFDVGAAYGTWGRMASCYFTEAKVHMFEPAYTEVEAYSSGIDQLVSEDPNRFVIHPFALGAEDRTQKFFINPENPTGNTMIGNAHRSENWNNVDTQFATIDKLVQSGMAPQPDFIKIDAQGAELEVLKGAKQTLLGTQVLLLELWLQRGYGKQTPLFNEVINWLLPFGFHVIDMTGTWRRPEDDQLISQDMLFAHESAKIGDGFQF